MIRWVRFLRTENKERLKNKAEKIIGSRILHIFRIFFSFFSFSTFSSSSFWIFLLVFYFILLFFSQEWRGKAWSWLPGLGSSSGSKELGLGAESLPKSQRALALQPWNFNFSHLIRTPYSGKATKFCRKSARTNFLKPCNICTFLRGWVST